MIDDSALVGIMDDIHDLSLDEEIDDVVNAAEVAKANQRRN